ncbi:hypothetical protein ABZP36_008774 [Zizania latifolia]
MSDVPGYFVGRPTNIEAKPKEKERLPDEQSPPANTEIPGGAHASPAAELRARRTSPAAVRPNPARKLKQICMEG